MLELSLHILDIVENSTRAGATNTEITLVENTYKDTLFLEIKDNGSGMSEDALKKVLDPFYTTKTVRNVGLGLQMLAQATERTEGHDIASTLVTLIAGNPDVDFIYRHQHNNREYVLDTNDVKKEIDDVPINHVEVLHFIREHVQEGLKEIGAEA